eukprot:SAG31_NODE_138_length_22877_cov_29.540917_20_plen_150_part_00
MWVQIKAYHSCVDVTQSCCCRKRTSCCQFFGFLKDAAQHQPWAAFCDAQHKSWRNQCVFSGWSPIAISAGSATMRPVAVATVSTMIRKYTTFCWLAIAHTNKFHAQLDTIRKLGASVLELCSAYAHRSSSSASSPFRTASLARLAVVDE